MKPLSRIPLDIVAVATRKKTKGVLVAVLASDLDELEQEHARYSHLMDRWDYFWDEGFNDDPFAKMEARDEIERCHFEWDHMHWRGTKKGDR